MGTVLRIGVSPVYANTISSIQNRTAILVCAGQPDHVDWLFDDLSCYFRPEQSIKQSVCQYEVVFNILGQRLRFHCEHNDWQFGHFPVGGFGVV
jgi:hypothetical protein